MERIRDQFLNTTGPTLLHCIPADFPVYSSVSNGSKPEATGSHTNSQRKGAVCPGEEDEEGQGTSRSTKEEEERQRSCKAELGRENHESRDLQRREGRRGHSRGQKTLRRERKASHRPHRPGGIANTNTPSHRSFSTSSFQGNCPKWQLNQMDCKELDISSETRAMFICLLPSKFG